MAREQGISTCPPLTSLCKSFGFNPLSEGVLDGTYIMQYDLTPEMKAYFDTVQSTASTDRLSPIHGVITSEDFQHMFSLAKEKTSSDLRTLNYSI
jgi:hypothetical protein